MVKKLQKQSVKFAERQCLKLEAISPTLDELSAQTTPEIWGSFVVCVPL